MEQVSSYILVWNEETGFIRINEGDGSNLLKEDIKEGYVDYIMYDMLEYDGIDLVENDGGQVMLTKPYQEMFSDKEAVVKYMVDAGWIPDVQYIYLYAK